MAFSTAVVLFVLGALMSMVNTMAITGACEGTPGQMAASSPSPDIAGADEDAGADEGAGADAEAASQQPASSVNAAVKQISPAEVAECINAIRSDDGSEENDSGDGSEEPTPDD